MRKNYHLNSLKIAIAGLVYAFSTHANFRIHAALSIFALILSIVLRISKIELLIIIATILLGFTTEFLNTAIESVCNLITKEWREDIKIAKDVSAAMVLIVAIGSVVIALIIFLPYIL